MKNVMFMSVKSVWSDIITAVNQKGNNLYDMFVMKEAFSSFCFLFRDFMLTFFMLKFSALTWCE